MKYEKLHLEDVSKTQFGRRVLDQVTLDVYRGELHMVLGACGAGKTTLAHLVTGQLQPDAGKVYYNGNVCDITSSWQATQMGIRSLSADSGLIEEMSVQDNILLGKEPVRAGFLVHDRQAEKHLKGVCQRLGLRVDLRARVDTLGFAEKRLVEMVKLWYARCELAVLDDIGLERFSAEEIGIFQRIVGNIKAEGGSLLLFSREVRGLDAVADLFSYLKDGRVEYKSHTVPRDWEVRENWPEVHRQHENNASGQIVLSARDISTPALRHVSLEAHAGEILGVTGSSTTVLLELAQVLGGQTQPLSGELQVASQCLHLHTPADAVQNGVVTIFGRSADSYLFPEMALEDQVTLPMLHRTGRASFINRAAQRILTEKCLRAAGVPWEPPETMRRHEIIRMLLARCEWVKARVIVCHEMTDDMPQAQKLGIHRMIREMAGKGYAILLLSIEGAELLSLCDRVLELDEAPIRAVAEEYQAEGT